jgi:hypothetical protein
VLRVLTVRAGVDKGGVSMKIGVRAVRALMGLSWSVASNSNFNFVPRINFPIWHNAPIFKTGLLISLPATVGPLVGMEGEGRATAVAGKFVSDASAFRFGNREADSGALA